MNKKLYVGNLPYGADDAGLAAHFGSDGLQVVSAKIMLDRETGRSRGFGFVEMATPEEAQKAAERFNGQPFMGRPLTVNEAQERTPGGGGGGPRLPRPAGSPGGPGAGGFNRGPRPDGGGFNRTPRHDGGGFGGGYPPAGFEPPASNERPGRRDRDRGKDKDRRKRGGNDDDWS